MNSFLCRSLSSSLVRFTLALALIALLVFVGMPTAFAQIDRAVLEGTVSDPSGSVIAMNCPPAVPSP